MFYCYWVFCILTMMSIFFTDQEYKSNKKKEKFIIISWSLTTTLDIIPNLLILINN